MNTSPIIVHLFEFQIWDIQDQCCLFTADPKASRIHGDISACSYFPAMKSLFIAADCMAMLSLKIRLVAVCFIHHKNSMFSEDILQIFHKWTNVRLMVSKILNKKTDDEHRSYRFAQSWLRVECNSLIFIALLFILLCFSSVRPQFRSRLAVSHNEPVICCGYSEEFRQVVSCTERSVSKFNAL